MATHRNIELCLASTHFFPPRGGATLRFLRYVPGLTERGINIQIITGTPKAKKSSSSYNAEKWTGPPDDAILPAKVFEGVRIHRVRLPKRAGWPRSIIFSQAILNFCHQPGYRPNVLQVVSSFQPRSLPWVIRMRKLGIRVVYAYTLAANAPSNPLKRFFRRWTMRALYGHLDCVVVSSDVMRDLVLAVGAKTRTLVIPNGVDLKRFRPAIDPEERKAFRASLGLGDIHQMMTFIGAVHPRKGVDLLLEAWVSLAKRFPMAHVFLLGLRKDFSYPNLAEFRRKIEGLMSASGAPDRVHFVGLVGNVEDYLRASDVFVFPSVREGVPNAVIEAMACGLPVVLTPFKGLSGDFGTPGREYLLVERSHESLAAVVTDVLENDALRSKLGHHARSWVEKTMDLDQVLDRYARLYRELADQACPSREKSSK